MTDQHTISGNVELTQVLDCKDANSSMLSGRGRVFNKISCKVQLSNPSAV